MTQLEKEMIQPEDTVRLDPSTDARLNEFNLPHAKSPQISRRSWWLPGGHAADEILSHHTMLIQLEQPIGMKANDEKLMQPYFLIHRCRLV
jgi:hypothetical protein